MVLSKSVSDKFERNLGYIDPVFAIMWKRGGIHFSEEFDHAALEVIDGSFRVSFNPKYWKRIKTRHKLFVICHEYLHVILGHWLFPPKKVDEEWWRIAQDIQVNEMLISKFGFSKSEIKNWDEQAWIETAFREKSHLIKLDEDAQYYYKILMKCLHRD